MEIIKGKLYRNPKTGLVVMANNKESEEGFSGQVIIGDKFWKKGMYFDRFGISWFQPYSAEIIIKEVIDFSKVQFVEMNDGEVVFASGNHSGDRFTATSLKVSHFQFYEKSDAKKVVTPKFE